MLKYFVAYLHIGNQVTIKCFDFVRALTTEGANFQVLVPRMAVPELAMTGFPFRKISLKNQKKRS